MEKDYIPFELALELKSLGFYEKCSKYFKNDGTQHPSTINYCYNFRTGDLVSSPLFSQVFRWFRKKYKNLHGSIEQTNSYKDEYTVYIGTFGYIEGNLKDEPKVFISYEEAELECLKKLIEIIKKK
jgi:hypothetical protein